MSSIAWPKLNPSAWRAKGASLFTENVEVLLQDSSAARYPESEGERLLSVLEKAECGSLRLSRDVARAADWTVVGKDLNGREIWLCPNTRNTSWLPPFTQNLDAALKLVPDGRKRPMEIRLAVHDRISGGLSTCEIRDFVGPHHVCVRRALAVAKTSALATCIAALRARASLAADDAREIGGRDTESRQPAPTG